MSEILALDLIIPYKRSFSVPKIKRVSGISLLELEVSKLGGDNEVRIFAPQNDGQNKQSVYLKYTNVAELIQIVDALKNARYKINMNGDKPNLIFNWPYVA